MRGAWLSPLLLCTVFIAHGALAQGAPGRTDPSGLLFNFGQQLDDAGIRVRAQVVDEYANNPTGGVHQGGTNVGQLQAGASFDLDKIMGLHGAYVHVTFVHDYGSGLSHDLTGTFIKAQEIYKNQFPKLRLGVIAFEQKLFNDRLDIFVGRLGTTTFYGRLSNTCYFQSGITCSVPQILNSSAGFTFPTSATWGANIRYTPFAGSGTYIEAGAFEVNQFIQQTTGFDFSTDKATGVTIPAEINIGNFNLETKQYPADLKIGGYVSTAPFNDPFFNTRGQSVGLDGGKPFAAHTLRHGVYIMGEQAIWHPASAPYKSLSLFAGVIKPLEDEEVMDLQVYGGAVLHGVIPSRPHDIISFTASHFTVSEREIEFLRDARIKAGGEGVNSPNENAFELDYNALVWPSIRLSPNFQYISNPDNSSLPNTSVLPKNILIVGIKFSVNITGLLGMPLAPNLSD
jgi:porin